LSELFFDSALERKIFESSQNVISGSLSECFQEAFMFLNPDCESSESLRDQLLLQFEVVIDLPGLTGIEKVCLVLKAIPINNQISGKVDKPTKIDDHNNVLAQIITLTNADLENLLRVTAACLNSVCLLPISKEDSDEIMCNNISKNLSNIEKFKNIIFEKDRANPGFAHSVLNFLRDQKEREYPFIKNESVVDGLVTLIGLAPELFDAAARQVLSERRFGAFK